MLLGQTVQAGELGTGPLALIATCILIPALGALVKWWMSSSEKSIAAIAASIEKLTDSVGEHGKTIAVLEAHREQHTKEIEGLRNRLHELGNSIQRVDTRIEQLKRAGP